MNENDVVNHQIIYLLLCFFRFNYAFGILYSRNVLQRWQKWKIAWMFSVHLELMIRVCRQKPRNKLTNMFNNGENDTKYVCSQIILWRLAKERRDFFLVHLSVRDALTKFVVKRLFISILNVVGFCLFHAFLFHPTFFAFFI